MGTCETSKNTKEQPKNPPLEKKLAESIKLKEKNNTIGEDENTRSVRKSLLTVSTFKNTDPFFPNISKSICKIEIKTDNQIESNFGTGFLLKFLIEEEMFYCLMSNRHKINNDIINNHNSISIYNGSEHKLADIKLDEKERYINSFNDMGLDIFLVEILDNDIKFKDHFLYPEQIENSQNLIKSRIYIPQYWEGNVLKKSIGEITKIIDYELTYLGNAECSSLGSPIFLENSDNVLGIHKSSDKKHSLNYGSFIYPVVKIIKNDMIKTRNNGKFVNSKYIWDDGRYYIGELKNNLPHGKGIKYYKNGNILYEGDFINGKFEGNGKYIYNDGNYFIGQYKNGLRNGSGKLFYKNNKTKSEANYINGNAEGDAKCYSEDGTYYIGQIKNDLKHGKGKEYYSNGKIMYEGDYINDKREGNGKFIWEDGEYYIGQWKNGLRNGKGKHYYANGNIRYDGDYVDGKREGNGKRVWADGECYIGQWKKDLREGKGKEYYPDGKIMYEGDWINGKLDGNGKCIWENGECYIGQYKIGLRHGKGKYYYPNGNLMYEGDYFEDKRDGNGKYYYEDGKYYIGQMKNGLSHGKGIEYYPNGNIMYEGDYIDDKREGNGKYIWEDGEFYIGQWKNNLRYGKGKEYDANGNIMYEGNWINGAFVGL